MGLLHDVEVMVESRWERSAAAAAATQRLVLPRDARAAAFSYDGRESAGDLRSLVTLALADSSRYHAVSLPGPADGLSYLEMVRAERRGAAGAYQVDRGAIALGRDSRAHLWAFRTRLRERGRLSPGCGPAGFAPERRLTF